MHITNGDEHETNQSINSHHICNEFLLLHKNIWFTYTIGIDDELISKKDTNYDDVFAHTPNCEFVFFVLTSKPKIRFDFVA